jgi:hypothetical protein
MCDVKCAQNILNVTVLSVAGFLSIIESPSCNALPKPFFPKVSVCEVSGKPACGFLLKLDPEYFHPVAGRVQDEPAL